MSRDLRENTRVRVWLMMVDRRLVLYTPDMASAFIMTEMSFGLGRFGCINKQNWVPVVVRRATVVKNCVLLCSISRNVDSK